MDISTWRTPFTAQDARCILGLDHREYAVARGAHALATSLRWGEDPTGRFAFHCFWDMVVFQARRRLDPDPTGGAWWAVEEVLVAAIAEVDTLAEARLEALTDPDRLGAQAQEGGKQATSRDGAWERWVAALIREVADEVHKHLRSMSTRAQVLH